METKILVITNPLALEKKIEQFVNGHGFTLVGPVTMGFNQNNTPVYVATLIKEDPKKGEN